MGEMADYINEDFGEDSMHEQGPIPEHLIATAKRYQSRQVQAQNRENKRKLKVSIHAADILHPNRNGDSE